MLSNKYFYFSLLRKYVAMFGSLFNNIIIERTDSNGNITQTINVPINYSEKEKMLTRMKQDPSIQKQASIVLPAISFFLDGYNFDSERHTSSNGKYMILNKPDITWQFKEAPWNFHFTVWIYAKNNSDASKMIEQILPFFSPHYSVKALLIPNRPPVDIAIELVSVSHPNTETESFKERPVLIWELHFTLLGYLYGPIQTSPPIKLVNLQFYDAETLPQANTINNDQFGISNKLINIANTGQYEYDFTAALTPGLTSGGQPTSNSSLSVPYANINYDDDWGIVEAINQLETQP